MTKLSLKSHGRVIPSCYTKEEFEIMRRMNMIQVEHLSKVYGKGENEVVALNDVSFSIKKGEFVAIMGASGSGKTTLLNCISTIDKVTAGHIYVAGQDITALKSKELNKFRREELGFIFQDFNLLDTLTAYENIALALSIQNEKYKEINLKVKKVAYDLGIEDILMKCQEDRNRE